MDKNSNLDWADVADLHSTDAEDPTLFEKAGDFVMKGIPLALASGATSIVNTAVSFGNMFGDFEKVDFANKVKEYDDDLFKYYDKNQSAIDLGGFIGTSLIPGTLGMKGLKALQTLKSGEGIGGATRAVTGFFKANEDKYLKAAAETLNSPTQKVFGMIDKNKLMAIANGVGEEALQGAAFETAVLLTMNQNPVMEPKERDNYFWSIVHDIPNSVENALIFGGVGGLVRGAVTAGKINKQISDDALRLLQNRAIEQVGLTNLKDGTIMAEQYRIIGDAELTLKEMENLVGAPQRAEGVVNEKAIIAQKETIAAMKEINRAHIMDSFVRKGDEDIGAELFKALEKVTPSIGPGGYGLAKEELIARSFGGSQRLSRIGEGQLDFIMSEVFDNPDVRARLYEIAAAKGIKVFETPMPWNANAQRVHVPAKGATHPGVLPELIADAEKVFAHEMGHATTMKEGVSLLHLTDADMRTLFPDWDSIVKISKKFKPEMWSHADPRHRAYAATPNEILADVVGAVMKGEAQWTEVAPFMKKLGVTRDHIGLPDVPKMVETAEHMPSRVGKTNRYINLVTGNIVDSAFPRAVDIGKSEIKKDGKIYTNGKIVEVSKEYNYLENSPTDSINHFWLEHNKPLVKSNTPLDIHVDNIPALEAAVENGYTNVTVTGYKGVSSDLGQILREVKDDAIVDLMTRGKSLDFIERALNVPQEYITAGQKYKGPITLDSLKEGALQRFDQPIFAKIEYSSAKNMDKFMAEGMLRVQQQQQMAQSARTKAAALIFGADYANMPASLGRLEGVTTIGIGASMTKSADAARGSTGMIALQVGKMQNKLAKDLVINWQNELHSLRTAIKEDPAALYKRNINAGILRGSSEDMVRMPELLLPSSAWDQLILVPRSFMEAAEKEINPMAWVQTQLPKMRTAIVQEPLASSEAQYLIKRQQITAAQAEKWNVVNAAKGSEKTIEKDVFYEPPVNTERQPFFAMVRSSNPLEDLRPISMIFAQTAEQLTERVAQVKAKYGDILEVFTKDEIKKYKELQTTYDSGMLFGKTFVDSALQREGKMSSFIPRKDAYIFQEEDTWLWNQAQAISRQGVEMQYGQEMAQLRFMKKNWDVDYSSRFGAEKLTENSAKNPYQQMINTFLNLPQKSFYENFWGKFNEGAQAAYNTMTDAWKKGYEDATAGKLSFQEAEAIAQRAGYSAPFGKVTKEVFDDTFKDKNSLSILVSKVNMAASTLMIRMDALNAVINVMSLPVLLAAESSATRKAIQDSLGLTVTVPGTQHQLPSTMKLIYEAVESYWKKDTIQFGGQTIEKKSWFKDIQAIRDNPQMIQDALAFSPEMLKSPSGLAGYSKNLASKIGEFGATATGNNLAEELVRYIAADVGLKLAKAQGITSRGELAAYVNLTVNRVHGNYLASQRPGIFSGPVGQAIGLFQTYQFNMIQQMTRHLQEGNYKAVGVAAAMQNTIFGLQGNPLFWQLNKHIGNSNSDHGDIVTGTADVVGGDVAKWMLYGLGANALQVNLYNRGDLTPRFTTVLPTSVQDFPAVSIMAKSIGATMDMFKNIGNGAPIADSILQGIAYAGFNRPLAGIAQLVSGKKTTGSGSLMAAYNDVDVMLYAAKLAGGEPLNNAVAMDSYYRTQQYKTDSNKRMQDLGEAVKFTASGKTIDPTKYQDFLNRYTEAGGDVKNFNKFMIHAEKNANISIVNQMKANRKNPLAQKQLGWLGADLEDVNVVKSEGEGEMLKVE